MNARNCAFPDCNRAALRSWTMCARHYSAGGFIKNEKRKDG